MRAAIWAALALLAASWRAATGELSAAVPALGAVALHGALATPPAASNVNGSASNAPAPQAAAAANSTAAAWCDRSCRRCADLDQQLVLPAPLRATANATAEIVVSHCRHALGWIPSARRGIEQLQMALTRITVYTKCGKHDELRALPALRGAHIVSLPNVGRCDHVWAYHLAQRYEVLADLVLFVKDSTFDYPLRELRSLLLDVPQVVDETRSKGFSCFRRPHLAVSTWHLRRESWKFRIASYVSADEQAKLRRAQAEVSAGRLTALTADPDPFSDRQQRVRSAESVERTITSKAQFTADMGMCEFVGRALGGGDALRALLRQTYVQVCYGGSFACTADRARAHSRDTYRRLELMLQRADNLEEGHMMERLWAALLAPPMDPNITRHFATTSGRGYAMIDGPMGISYPGAVKQCCCQRPSRDLWRRPSPLGDPGPVLLGRTTWDEALGAPASRGSPAPLRAQGAKSIVLVAGALEPGSTSTYLLQLGAWLRRQEYNVLCVTPAGSALAAAAFGGLGIEVAVLPEIAVAVRATERPSAWRVLSDELRSNRRPLFASPDIVVWSSVVWADVLYANFWSRWCRFAPRFVWLVQEMELAAEYKRANGFWYGHAFITLRSPQLLRRTLLNADAVVFLADAQRAIWQLHDHVHFHVIPPHAEHVALAEPGLANPTRASLGLANSSFVISVFGPLCEHKRQHLALDALEGLLRRSRGAHRDDDVHLLVIGGRASSAASSYVLELQMRASNPPLAGHVTMLPFEPEGWRLLALADLHVSAASRDTYPLNTLEAMRLGVPTIAVAAGGVAEQYQELAGLQWMLTPADDSSAFLRAVERAFRLFQAHRESFHHLGELQRRALAASSSAERFGEGWARVLERIAGQSRVSEACGLWSPGTGCARAAGAYGVTRPM